MRFHVDGWRQRLVAAGAVVLCLGVLGAGVASYLARPAHANGTGGGSACLSTNGAPACSYSGDSAVLDYSVFDPSSNGCVYTAGWIFATSSIARDPGAAPSGITHATVFVYKRNSCTSTLLLDAYGEADGVSFTATGSLGTARLTGTVPLWDAVTGNAITASVDMTWTGTGDPTGGTTTSHVRTPSYQIEAHQTATSRVAEVSGSVSDGSNTLFQASALSGSLASVSAGNVIITRQ